MKNKLWDYYDGEPFMENPYLGILGGNPKRKKKGRKMAARRRRRSARRVHRRGRKSTVRHTRRVSRRRRTTRRRRNPWTVAGSVIPLAANPRRRRRSRRANPKRRRRHSMRHRNPFGIAIPSFKSVAFAGVGFVGPSFVSSTLTNLAPSLMTQVTGMGLIGKYVIRIGSVLGLHWLTKRFVGQNEANMVLIGGGVNVALTLVSDFAPGLLPANPLAMYVPTQMPMSAQAGMRGMRQYVPLRGMAGPKRIPSAVAFPTPFSGGASQGGAYGGVAARFKRF